MDSDGAGDDAGPDDDDDDDDDDDGCVAGPPMGDEPDGRYGAAPSNRLSRGTGVAGGSGGEQLAPLGGNAEHNVDIGVLQRALRRSQAQQARVRLRHAAGQHDNVDAQALVGVLQLDREQVVVQAQQDLTMPTQRGGGTRTGGLASVVATTRRRAAVDEHNQAAADAQETLPQHGQRQAMRRGVFHTNKHSADGEWRRRCRGRARGGGGGGRRCRYCCGCCNAAG